MKIHISITDTSAGARLVVEKFPNGIQDHAEDSVSTLLAQNIINFIRKITMLSSRDALVIAGNDTLN